MVYLEVTKETHSMNEENQQPETEAEAAKRQFENMKDAFRSGSQAGAAKAREAAPTVKSAFSEALHDIAYGVAFGSNFVGAFAEEFVPKAVRDGFAKGAAAGRAASDKARTKAADVITPDAPAPEAT